MRAEETDVVFDRKGMLVRAMTAGLELTEKPSKKRKKMDFNCQYCTRRFQSYEVERHSTHERHHVESLHTGIPGPCSGLPEIWIQNIDPKSDPKVEPKSDIMT